MRRLPNGQLLFAVPISLSLRSRLPWVRLKLYRQPENSIGFSEGAGGGSALAQFGKIANLLRHLAGLYCVGEPLASKLFNRLLS